MKNMKNIYIRPIYGWLIIGLAVLIFGGVVWLVNNQAKKNIALVIKRSKVTLAPYNITEEINEVSSGFFAVQEEPTVATTIPMKWTRFTGIARWNEIERIRGRYDFSKLDNVVRDFRGKGMNVVVVVHPGKPPFSKVWEPVKNCRQKSCPVKPAYYKDWKKFIKEMLRRYPDNFLYWQIGNEYANTNIFWGGSVDDYLNILRLAYEAKQEANPKAKMILTGFIKPHNMGRCYLGLPDCSKGSSFAFQDTLLSRKNAKYFDIVDLHLFNYFKYNPYQVEEAVEGIRRKMKTEGYSKPVAVLEWTAAFVGKDKPAMMNEQEYVDWVKNVVGVLGCVNRQCNPQSADFKSALERFEEEQAKDFIKQFVSLLEQKVWSFIYVQFADYNSSWDSPLWNFQGVLRRNPINKRFIAKKPAYYNYLLLTDKIGKFIEAEKIDEDTYQFITKKGSVVIAWSDKGRNIDVSPYISTPNVKVTKIVTKLDRNGNPIYYPEKIAPSSSVYIDENPVFIEQSTSTVSLWTKEINSIKTGSGQNGIDALAYNDGYLYAGGNGLYIWNMTRDRANPVLVFSSTVDEFKGIRSVLVDDNKLYIAGGRKTERFDYRGSFLAVYSLANGKANQQKIWQWRSAAFKGIRKIVLDKKRNLAYAAAWDSGLLIFDLNRQKFLRWYIPPLVLGGYKGEEKSIWGLDYRDGFVYLAMEKAGLAVVDVRNQFYPKQISITSYDGLDAPYSGYAKDVLVVGNYAFVPYDYNGVVVFNIQNPQKPFVAAAVDPTPEYNIMMVAKNAIHLLAQLRCYITVILC